MISKINFEESDILGFRVEGKIEKAEFVNLMQELIPEIESPEHFKMYIEVPKMEGMDLELVWESLKFAKQELKNYFEKVDKIAFVADKGWLRTLASAEYALIPSIEQKSFSFDDKDVALHWVKK